MRTGLRKNIGRILNAGLDIFNVARMGYINCSREELFAFKSACQELEIVDLPNDHICHSFRHLDYDKGIIAGHGKTTVNLEENQAVNSDTRSYFSYPVISRGETLIVSISTTRKAPTSTQMKWRS